MSSQLSWVVRLTLVSLLATGMAGCQKKEISAYEAPSEGAAPQAAGGGSQSPTMAAGGPTVEWKLPAGWQEGAGDEVSLKNISITGPNGAEAKVSITRLGNLAGKEALLVNMWRQQAGLSPVSEEEAVKVIQPIEFASAPGSAFEVLGTNQGQPFEIVTAFAHRPDGSWFCKLSGNAALVAAQKPAFLEFVKSLKFTKPKGLEPVAVTAPSTGQFHWQVPSMWKAEAAGEMQVAKFSLAGADGAKAEVFVSLFDTDTGGNLANINRWRRQIGLDAVQEKDLALLVSPLEPTSPEAVLVDMANGDKRLIGAIVPRDGKFWFYKLVGDSAAVAPAKEAYVTFAKSKP